MPDVEAFPHSSTRETWAEDAARLVDAARRLDRDHAIREIAGRLHTVYSRGIQTGMKRADHMIGKMFGRENQHG